MYKNIMRIIIFSLFFWSRPSMPSMQQIFTRIYENNIWQDQETRSGSGSSVKVTATIRKEIPLLLQQLNAKTLLDCPCGDFNWMKEINLDFLEKYIGIDIVPAIIKLNSRYVNEKKSFKLCNMVTDQLEQVDVILCRDCLVHFNFLEIFTTLRNFKRSKSKYLLTTTYTNIKSNNEIGTTGHWRPLNLQLAPFNFPEPIVIINENASDFDNGIFGKCLGLWALSDI